MKKPLEKELHELIDEVFDNTIDAIDQEYEKLK